MKNNSLHTPVRNDELDRIIRAKWDEIVDAGTEWQECFDELCNYVDDRFDDYGAIPYVRIFWHNDSDSDLDNVCDELMDIAQRFDVEAYCVVESSDMEATIVVAITYRKEV